MSPTPIDQRTIDPELKAEIDAAYANIEQQSTGGYAEVDAPQSRPFMKSLKTNAVVELTEQARERSARPSQEYEAKLHQVWAYTKYINDLRDRKLGNK